jgi:hypothetical protein
MQHALHISGAPPRYEICRRVRGGKGRHVLPLLEQHARSSEARTCSLSLSQ